MRIHHLSLSSFRNIHEAALRFPARVTFVTGRNGQGKTNLIEAVYLLSQAKSFRSASPSELVSWNLVDGVCAITADVEGSDGKKSIAIKLENGRRKVTVNGKKVSKASLFYGQFKAIAFTPDELQIVKSGPSQRRQFVDRILAMVDPSFVDSSVSYERALKSRNALLKSSGQKSDISSQLGTWNAILAEHGVVIAKRRANLIKELLPGFKEYYQYFLKESQIEEAVNLIYESNFLAGSEVMSRREAELVLQSSQNIDIRRSVTTSGTQRDEIVITLDTGSGPKIARTMASQGQSRSIVLALKLAAVDYLTKLTGEAPVLLLDDIESELDEVRREALFSLIQEAESQVFVTLTELNQELKSLVQDSAVINVAGGKIEAPF